VPTLALIAGVPNLVGSRQQFEEEQASAGVSTLANLRHFPIGLLFTLAAPFPWTASTLADLAAIPEMLVWYACFILAIIGLVALFKARRFEFGPGVLALGGLTFIFDGELGCRARCRGRCVVSGCDDARGAVSVRPGVPPARPA
jgi:hypothetical protein